MSKSTAPRCGGSDTTQSIEGEIEVDRVMRSAWAYGTHKSCTVCGQDVKFRVRATDMPPWARVLPHRTDGTPTR
jgi:hypothetical protein